MISCARRRYAPPRRALLPTDEAATLVDADAAADKARFHDDFYDISRCRMPTARPAKEMLLIAAVPARCFSMTCTRHCRCCERVISGIARHVRSRPCAPTRRRRTASSHAVVSCVERARARGLARAPRSAQHEPATCRLAIPAAGARFTTPLLLYFHLRAASNSTFGFRQITPRWAYDIARPPRFYYHDAGWRSGAKRKDYRRADAADDDALDDDAVTGHLNAQLRTKSRCRIFTQCLIFQHIGAYF